MSTRYKAPRVSAYDEREAWARRPAVRLVHVRRDSEGRWFWYHWLCRKGESGLTWGHAMAVAYWHTRGPCASGTMFISHIDADPDTNTLRASWLCPECRQYCASHNPCDCCSDEESA